MQLQLEAISLPGLLQANYIFPGSTKLLSLYYVSFLSDAPETEKPSASHFICGDICYSLGNYYSHPGFTAHSQAAVFLSLSTMKSEFLCLRKTCGTSAKNYRNPEKWEPKWTTSKAFFAQKLKFHFLDRPSFNINLTFPWVEFRNSGSLILLKDRVAEKGVSDLFQYTKKGSGSFTAVIWTELQPKSESWLWKGKLLHVLLSQLAGQPDNVTAGSMFHPFPLQRH